MTFKRIQDAMREAALDRATAEIDAVLFSASPAAAHTDVAALRAMVADAEERNAGADQQLRIAEAQRSADQDEATLKADLEAAWRAGIDPNA